MRVACFTCSQTEVLSTMTNVFWDILQLLLSPEVNIEHVCFANQKLLVCEKCADILNGINYFREVAVNTVNAQIESWDMEIIKQEPCEIDEQAEYNPKLTEIMNKNLNNQEPSEDIVITPEIVKLERHGDLLHCILSENLVGRASSEMSSLLDISQTETDTTGLKNWMVNTFGEITCDVKLEGDGMMLEGDEQTSYTDLPLVTNNPSCESGVQAPGIKAGKLEKKTRKKKKSKDHNKVQAPGIKVGKLEKKTRKKKKSKDHNKNKTRRKPAVFRTVPLTTKELQTLRDEQRAAPSFTSARHRCVSCIEAFQSLADKRAHRQNYHSKKASFMKCRICKQTMKTQVLIPHVTTHYRFFVCPKCEFRTNVLETMRAHACPKGKKKWKKHAGTEEVQSGDEYSVFN